MSDSRDREIEALRMEVASLRKEVTELRDFIRGLFAMMNEGEEYEGMPEFMGGAEYGRMNT